MATSAEWYNKEGELSKGNVARSEKRHSRQTGEIVMDNDMFSFIAVLEYEFREGDQRVTQNFKGNFGKGIR